MRVLTRVSLGKEPAGALWPHLTGPARPALSLGQCRPQGSAPPRSRLSRLPGVSPPARRTAPAQPCASTEGAGGAEEAAGEPPERRCGSGWAGSRCCLNSEAGRSSQLGAGRAAPARGGAGRAGRAVRAGAP